MIAASIASNRLILIIVRLVNAWLCVRVQGREMQTGSYLSLLTCLHGHDGKGSTTTRAELMSMRKRVVCIKSSILQIP